MRKVNITKKEQFFGAFSKFKVYINDEFIGVINPSKLNSFVVENPKIIYVKHAFMKSNILDITNEKDDINLSIEYKFSNKKYLLISFINFLFLTTFLFIKIFYLSWILLAINFVFIYDAILKKERIIIKKLIE